jgi:hypothetical protein
MPFSGRRHKFGEWRQWGAGGNSAVRPSKPFEWENGVPISGQSAYDRGWDFLAVPKRNDEGRVSVEKDIRQSVPVCL